MWGVGARDRPSLDQGVLFVQKAIIVWSFSFKQHGREHHIRLSSGKYSPFLGSESGASILGSISFIDRIIQFEKCSKRCSDL